MIALGLIRITQLLQDSQIRWRAIHVAGTNGKGSVCAYVSAMLNAGKIKCGRFTSPHLIDRWDCITINDKTVKESVFSEVEAMVKARDATANINASEFELLTATAFEIFNREKVEVGVVEVGLGGRYDATNVLPLPAVAVITKIGKDHQQLLGNTLEEIAYQKAGIMKLGVPCVVDGSNDSTVLKVLARSAKKVGASLHEIVAPGPGSSDRISSMLSKDLFEPHQKTNVQLAFEAVKLFLAPSHPSMDPWQLLLAVQGAVWPGRLQNLNIEWMTGRQRDILLDGAHNVQSAQILGSYVDRRLRKENQPVTWVIALSQGKDAQELLSCFVRPMDKLVAVEFGRVDGMPWVCSQKVKNLELAGEKLGCLVHGMGEPTDLKLALSNASDLAGNNPMVVAGSLYLVSDFLRFLRCNQLHPG